MRLFSRVLPFPLISSVCHKTLYVRGVVFFVLQAAAWHFFRYSPILFLVYDIFWLRKIKLLFFGRSRRGQLTFASK